MSSEFYQPGAVFVLEPLNETACELLNDPHNEPWIGTTEDGAVGFEIGGNRLSSSDEPLTLATMGRNGDIRLHGPTYSRVQCAFVVHETSKCVLFYDNSSNMTCMVDGDANVFPFERPRAHRRVLVWPHCNTLISMGGPERDILKFRLHWLVDAEEVRGYVKNRIKAMPRPALHHARTMDESDEELQYRWGFRMQAPQPRDLKMRFVRTRLLGTGRHSDVYEAIDVDSGDTMAVKEMHVPLKRLAKEQETKAKREMKLLSQAKHDHIVQHIASTWGDDDGRVRIFTNLAEGTLYNLTLAWHPQRKFTVEMLADTVLHQMLQALDFLDRQGLVHRDVKPENILYLNSDGAIRFQLSDFGTANLQRKAGTMVGTPYYQAPEMKSKSEQTAKVDIWGLYVTLVWMVNEGGFRALQQKPAKGNTVGWKNVLSITAKTTNPLLMPLRAMAREDPKKRASAAQMLLELYGGVGLTTPVCVIPPLEADDEAQCASLIPAPLALPFRLVAGIEGPSRQAQRWEPVNFAEAALPANEGLPTSIMRRFEEQRHIWDNSDPAPAPPLRRAHHLQGEASDQIVTPDMMFAQLSMGGTVR